MRRVKIEGSSFAVSAGYEPIQGQLTGVLEVEKSNGGLLRFSNVTMEDYVALMGNESFGKGVQKFLRTKNNDQTMMYPCMSVPATSTKEQREEAINAG